MKDMLLSEIIQNCKERKTCEGCEFKARSVRSCILGYQPAMWNLHIEIDDTPMFGKWIPCSERLPEEFERVLVTYEGFAHELVLIMAIINDDTMHWELDDGMRYPLDMITAWMPLPNPYKEGVVL